MELGHLALLGGVLRKSDGLGLGGTICLFIPCTYLYLSHSLLCHDQMKLDCSIKFALRGTMHASAEATGFPTTSSVIPAEFVYVMLTAFEVRRRGRIPEGELRSGDMFRC